MDAIRDACQRIYTIVSLWANFGVIWLGLLFYIPYLLIVGAFLLVLPFILFFIGISSHWQLALYIFVVMAIAVCVCYHLYFHRGDSESPLAGRPIIPESRAVRRSRSIIRNSRKRK